MIYLVIADLADPTLLLIGHADSFQWLANQIAARHDVILQQTIGNRHACLKFTPTACRDYLSRDKDTFEWYIDQLTANKVVEQLIVLATTDSPGHHYLDPVENETGFQIVASVGEYDPTIFED